MRNMLPPTVDMFGCTATMSAEQEVDIRTFGGFRNEGSNYGELEIMRFSVDRPEIPIIIRTFDRGSQQNPSSYCTVPWDRALMRLLILTLTLGR